MSSLQQLTRDHQRELLDLARRTIDSHLREGKRIPYSTTEEALREKCGAFVSIHTGDCLRGCIGIIQPLKPLYETIIECAICAATEDYRFDPLRLEELPESDLEISVLTVPVVVRNIEDIQVGRDGLIISEGFSKGLLLPQVATSNKWDLLTFLAQTCMKAGLPANAWKTGAKIEKFSAQVFSDHEMKQ